MNKYLHPVFVLTAYEPPKKFMGNIDLEVFLILRLYYFFGSFLLPLTVGYCGSYNLE